MDPACSPVAFPGLKVKDALEEQDLQTIDGAYCAEAYQKALKKKCIDAAIGRGSDVLDLSLFDRFWGGARLHQTRLKLK